MSPRGNRDQRPRVHEPSLATAFEERMIGKGSPEPLSYNLQPDRSSRLHTIRVRTVDDYGAKITARANYMARRRTESFCAGRGLSVFAFETGCPIQTTSLSRLGWETEVQIANPIAHFVAGTSFTVFLIPCPSTTV